MGDSSIQNSDTSIRWDLGMFLQIILNLNIINKTLIIPLEKLSLKKDMILGSRLKTFFQFGKLRLENGSFHKF